MECTVDRENQFANVAFTSNSTNSVLCGMLRVRADHQHQANQDKSYNFAYTKPHGGQGLASNSREPIFHDDYMSSPDNAPQSLKIHDYDPNGNIDSSNDSGLGHDSKLPPRPSVMPCESLGTPSDHGLRRRELEYNQSSVSKWEESLPEMQRFDDTKKIASVVQSSDTEVPIPATKKSSETKTDVPGPVNKNHEWSKLMKIPVFLLLMSLLALCIRAPWPAQVKDTHTGMDTETKGVALVTTKHIRAIAIEPWEWKKLARGLDIDEAQINRIAAENKGDEYEQRYQMLLHWIRKNGRDATVNILSGEFHRIHRKDLVETFLQG